MHRSRAHRIGMCDTANLGIDPIPSKYRASIADTDTDTDTDTCHLKTIHLNDQQHLIFFYNN